MSDTSTNDSSKGRSSNSLGLSDGSLSPRLSPRDKAPKDKRPLRRSESESTRSKNELKSVDRTLESSSGARSSGERKKKKRDKSSSSSKKEAPPTPTFDPTSVASTIAIIKEQTEKCQTQSKTVAEECAEIEAQNRALAQEVKQLETQLTQSRSEALPVLEAKFKSLQRALNNAQRDRNVLEQAIGKLDRTTKRHGDHALVMLMVASRLLKENEALHQQYLQEEEDTNPDTLYLAFEIILEELSKKMATLCPPKDVKLSREDFDQIMLGQYKYVEIDEWKQPKPEDDGADGE